jgi:hypothetical protein
MSDVEIMEHQQQTITFYQGSPVEIFDLLIKRFGHSCHTPGKRCYS